MKRFPFLLLALSLGVLLAPASGRAFLINEWQPIEIGGAEAAIFEEVVPGRGWIEPVSGIHFNWVPGGCFKMGSPPRTEGRDVDEGPVHEVCLSGFWIAQRETTQGQWRQIMRNNPAGFPRGDLYPVERVAWDDVESFIRKLDALYQETRTRFRLPTEAEWEFACRNRGQRVRFAGGGDPGQVSWNRENSGGTTQRTAAREASPLGLWDMSGNVWEWVADAYQGDGYARHARNDPRLESMSSYRVIRGGAWSSGRKSLRCANRGFEVFSTQRDDIGFRLVSFIAPPARRHIPEAEDLAF